MKYEPNKTDEIIGLVFGLLLCFIWIAILSLIEGMIYPNQSFVHKPIITWLNYGGIIYFFVNTGIYFFYTRKIGGSKAASSLIFLKSCLLGFVFWLFIIGIFFMNSGIPFWANLLIGYLIIIVIYILWNRDVSRKYPDKIKKNSE